MSFEYRKWTERQHGLVTHTQMLASGETIESIRWAVRDSRIMHYRDRDHDRRGVYSLVGVWSEYQPIMAACLAAGPTAAASHLGGAALWGVEQVKAGRVEITTFDNRVHRLPGVIVHRSRLDPKAAMTTRFNIPTVVPALVVVQLATTCSPYLVKKVANDLVKRNWTSFRSIREWSDIVGGGRQTELRELCDRAIDLGGHRDSPAARTLGERLKAAGAAPFEMDYRVETPEGDLLIDFAWPGPKVGLEYNGATDHASWARADDARRRSRLAAVGWRMLDANSGITYDEIVGLVLNALNTARRAS